MDPKAGLAGRVSNKPTEERGHLILGIRPGESLWIGDAEVVITSPVPVRVDVRAPLSVPVDRGSVRERKQAAA
jgi:sRNA-binding carbon storage regulator CsrA